jgi:type II secretory pathway component PulK
MKPGARRRGGALVAAMVTLLAVMLVAGAVVRSLLAAHRQARHSQHELQAQWLAESAIARAVAQLALQTDYTGETWQPAIIAGGGDEQTATVELSVKTPEAAAKTRRVIAIAHYPNHEWRRVTVRREYTLSLAPQAAPATAPEEDP